MNPESQVLQNTLNTIDADLARCDVAIAAITSKFATFVPVSEVTALANQAAASAVHAGAIADSLTALGTQTATVSATATGS